MNMLIYLSNVPGTNVLQDALVKVIFLIFFLLPVLIACIFKWLVILPLRGSVLPEIRKRKIMLDIFLVNSFMIFVIVFVSMSLKIFVVSIVFIILSVFFEAKYYSIVWHVDYKECLNEIVIPADIFPVIGMLMVYGSMVREL